MTATIKLTEWLPGMSVVTLAIDDRGEESLIISDGSLFPKVDALKSKLRAMGYNVVVEVIP